MKSPERQPKSHIENIRDRFMDFIGNPLNGILGYFDSLQDNKLSTENRERMLAGLQSSWSDFFNRLETFRNSGFESSGKIDTEHIDELLMFRDKDPLQPGVIEELNAMYRSVVDKS